MADDTEEDKRGSSPKENFNPLDEGDSDVFTSTYLRQMSNGENWGDDDDDDNSSDNNGEGGPSDEEQDGRTLGQQYSITPPQPRLRKRLKEKNSLKGRLDRSYKEYLINKRQQQSKAPVNIIKNEFQADPALCNLSEFDSDDNLDRDVLRERKDRWRRESKESKKTLSKLRLTDREEKRLSEDFGVLGVTDSVGPTSHLPLEGSGRFMSVKQKLMLPISAESRARRLVSEPRVCPKDREDFHAKFALLINLGTEAKKDREKLSACKRQMSEEQELWRSSVIEVIWLELRAYINNGRTPEEQFQLLKMERQQNEKVIDDITNFCFADAFSQECPDSALLRDSPAANISLFTDQLFREHVTRSVSASFSDVNLSDETVCLQEKALVQVQSLLERLDRYESCYSTAKACKQDNIKFKDPVFERRVKCLNLWLNITCDLCQKLKLFGRIIGAHSRDIQWPLVNFEFPTPQPREFLASPRASIPNVLETEPTDSSEEDIEESGLEEKEEGGGGDEPRDSSEASREETPQSENKQFLSPPCKQVKFQCGGDNSEHPSPCPSPGPVPAEGNLPLDTSTPVRGLSQITLTSAGSSVLSLSRASSDLSLDDSRQVRSSIYRHYVEKCLRKMGLQRLNIRLRDLFHRSLNRAKEALERPKEACYSDSSVDGQQPEEDRVFSEEATSSSGRRPSFNRGSSLSEHGEWSQQFIEMGLPSFRPTYLFIVRIQVDVIHECLKLRKDQRPIGDPSFLSIRQLIRECKEVLKGASLVKQYYHYMVNAVIWDEQEAEAKFEKDLVEFDEDMKSMLDVYFNYLQSWIYMLQSLPEASLGMKSALEEEWTFTKSICPFVMGGEAEAGKKFSALASSLLSSIADFVDTGIDDNTRNLYDDDFPEEDCDEEEDEGDENDNIDNFKREQKMADMKQNVQGILRNFKNLFNEARERASKALGFAKLLRKDLEIAADFNITVTTKELLTKLMETDHVQLVAPLSAGYMMFVPSSIISNERLIYQLLNVTSGREGATELTAKEEGYLLMMRCESGTDQVKECPRWPGQPVHVEPTAETAIALSHIEVMGLLFVVTHSGTLANQRKYFQNSMGSCLQLVNEQTSCHQSIAESLSELKTNAIELMAKLAQAIQQVNEKLNFNEVIQHEESILKLYRETMLKIYDFGFEYQKELMRLICRDQREKQCLMIVAFAKDWMSFVINKCEMGRGTRPRWATTGLEFISLACDPKNVVCLTDQQFQEFQKRIDDALTHIIGSTDNRSTGPGMSLSKSNLDLRGGVPSMLRLASCPEKSRINRSFSTQSANSDSVVGLGHPHSSSSVSSTPSTLGSSFFGDHPLSGDVYRSKPRTERLRISIEKLEADREQKLRTKRIIGNVSGRVHEPDIRMNVRRVNFRWQRGFKIGEGQFGKVYTAVNMITGELMAMKEMKFQPNDQQWLKETCDEIKNFEGINHKNLVKYYGVEVHKDEMLMFMEYCDSGSIEEVARIGLPEYMIRRYTKEIVLAVAHLHENNIVHRDIKGANIFLTSQGHVKLGDFGCSVKLKNQQTMPGENVNLVGTTAYMAPEVITQSVPEGYGRAADIWSLGCVVIEMATGKRPWHELEHNLQVMFKVGTGHSPPIPECLSREGKNFLSCCLVHDPAGRLTAAQLLDHMFVKCYDDVDNDSDSSSS
ncbi:mitogen-activated protein kinase kinase kinase 4 isoform X2 [Aplysia californica]|uniref:Mitogen-activated protein kinase kinase kinase 4 isoform X2 n=1 Tax=Aplysia californica TaxID=6500 RepID=A0ABM0K673_APLCA|nr:mitogen-activated protein kinase kinase kinase 4 isoform X2 [Aplysia californica]